ncbi:hypothetical protein MB02_14870 [Croceicoccus estronivorus]|nr:hypothetical protein MB02_14870 [Croceicoccus estronivorus]
MCTAFSTADRLLDRSVIWLLACAAVLALQTALIVTHWPWPDEYQALQIAVQAPDIATLLQWLRYEGHPPLWYLLLRSLAHLTEPLDTLWLAALLLAIPGQCLIIFASPFTRIERLLIALSEFFLFDFFTISRSQTLGVLVLLLVMATWRSRWVWIAIVLLPMCDFLFGVLSGIFVLMKWREGALTPPWAALWLLSGIVATWTVWPAPNMVSAFQQLGIQNSAILWIQKVDSLLIPFQGGLRPQWNSRLFPIANIAWIGFLALCWHETRDTLTNRVLLFGFIGLTLVFSLASYPLGLRHLMLIALFLILLAWHGHMQGKIPSGAFRTWLTIAALSGISTAIIALQRPFDTAHVAVAEIRKQGLENRHWMAFPEWRVSGLSALSGMKFERPEQHCMLDFVRWDYHNTLINSPQLENFLRDEITRHGRSYLVSDRTITNIPKETLLPLWKSPVGYDGLTYHLYVVGPNSDEKEVNLPSCVDNKRALQRL